MIGLKHIYKETFYFRLIRSPYILSNEGSKILKWYFFSFDPLIMSMKTENLFFLKYMNNDYKINYEYFTELNVYTQNIY